MHAVDGRDAQIADAPSDLANDGDAARLARRLMRTSGKF